MYILKILPCINKAYMYVCMYVCHGDFKQDSSGNLVSIRRGYKAVHTIVNRPVLILN